MEAITRATAEQFAELEMEAAAQEFSSIVEAHRPQIFRFLLASTRDVDLAETLTQECFLKAHRNWGSLYIGGRQPQGRAGAHPHSA